MTKLILFIGLPGSGKSSLAQKLITEPCQTLLISTDKIRGQLFGDEAIQGPWFLVWRELQKQLEQAARAIVQGKASLAIYDATNAARRQRKEAIALCQQTGFTHITGIWFQTPLWLCLSHNRHRQRQVPEEVIFRMYRQLRDAPPTLADGFDELIRYHLGEFKLVE
ncbi:AAA family ATPase [Aerosakkonemataceae cyanobacterium BLCC-F154]|uniref:AAA family ATPase n=1 Tax=Floridaenema fluviatile BLCC-F154 TaxID=3153640 RepID=A0ABV4YDJ2_9CYAN